MKRILTLLLAATLGHALLPAQTDSLRLLSYNVRNAVGLDGRRDPGRIGALIARSGADIAAIQEVDSLTRRSGHTDVLAEIGRAAGMHATFAPAIDYDGGRYGIGLLSREAPLRVRRIALPGREERRALLVCEFSGFTVACTHLSLTEADRMTSLDLLRRETRHAKKPFFLLGDWNDTPGSAFLQRLDKDFRLLNDTTQASWPADTPHDCIDYVAVTRKSGRHVTVLAAEVIPETRASDHRPLRVTVHIKRK